VPITTTATTDAPKRANTTTTTTITTSALPLTTLKPVRYRRNPRSNATRTEIATTTTLPITTTKLELTTIDIDEKKSATPAAITTTTVELLKHTTTDKITTTTRDVPRRYQRSVPVTTPLPKESTTTTIIKTKEHSTIKPDLNETWFAEGKLDEEWKNATFLREKKENENETDWEDNGEDLTIAIIEKYERSTIIHQEPKELENATTAAILTTTKDDKFVDITEPKLEKKEKKDSDSDDDDDDDDDELPKGAVIII
jgi:hypothetical protein